MVSDSNGLRLYDKCIKCGSMLNSLTFLDLENGEFKANAKCDTCDTFYHTQIFLGKHDGK